MKSARRFILGLLAFSLGVSAGYAIADVSVVSESATLTPNTTDPKNFGRSVDIGGDVIVAAYWGSDPPRPVEVFVRQTDGQWQHKTDLLSNDIEPGDAFGFSVATDGETVVVGAPFKWKASGSKVGAAYTIR